MIIPHVKEKVVSDTCENGKEDFIYDLYNRGADYFHRRERSRSTPSTVRTSRALSPVSSARGSEMGKSLRGEFRGRGFLAELA